jgi:hypothetical protein
VPSLSVEPLPSKPQLKPVQLNVKLALGGTFGGLTVVSDCVAAPVAPPLSVTVSVTS